MSLLKALEKTRRQYRTEFQDILKFVNTTEKMLTEKQKIKPDAKLSSAEQKELRELANFLLESATQSSSKGPSKVFRVKSEAVLSMVNQFMVPMRHKTFLTEMTLSYLIS